MPFENGLIKVFRDVWNAKQERNPNPSTPIFDWRITSVKEFYESRGLRFIIPVESTDLSILQLVDMWCHDNLTDVWARHWLRVLEDETYGWIRDDAIGRDVVFYAFKNGAEASLFSLRWAGKNGKTTH